MPDLTGGRNGNWRRTANGWSSRGNSRSDCVRSPTRGRPTVEAGLQTRLARVRPGRGDLKTRPYRRVTTSVAVVVVVGALAGRSPDLVEGAVGAPGCGVESARARERQHVPVRAALGQRFVARAIPAA